MKKHVFLPAFLALIAAMCAAGASATESPKAMTIPKIPDGQITVDGVMDDLY